MAEGESPKGVIVVNTTFRIAPWADALFAMDEAWWKLYYQEIRQSFLGLMYSVNDFRSAAYKDVIQVSKPFTSHGNSGAGAVHLAAKGGARRVVLLGYDCQHTDGQRHWHGNHPKGLGNADVVARWPAQFQRMKDQLPLGVEVVNCSRKTALTIFPRMDLGDALAQRQ